MRINYNACTFDQLVMRSGIGIMFGPHDEFLTYGGPVGLYT